MIAIYKRELRAYFHSFLGTLFIGAMLFLLGIYFTVYNLFMGYPYIGYALSSVVFLFLIGIPILTMRILAEERHQKTDQLILTSPVSVSGIVMGKFLALSTIFAIPVIIICFYPLILSIFGEIPFGESYLAVLGFFLYGLACIAIGIFVSSLTESQVISAIISFGILFLGYIMSGLCNMISTTGNLLTKILSAFDMVSRFDHFLNGSFKVTSVIYYLSVVLLFLIFTVQSIQKRRYQISTKTISMSAYSSSVVVITTALVVLVNLLIGEIPSKYTIFDVTANKLYSLTDETIAFADSIEEDVNIYVLVNEEQADAVLDTTLKNYAELNSHIKVSYVDPAVNPKFFASYTDSSLAMNSVIVEGANRSKVIDYNSIYETEFDYSTYSPTVTGYDGEGQITSAIAYVITEDMPKIYLTQGHGEASLEASFKSAMEKANIDYEEMNLMDYEEIPEDAQCVIVNAPTADFSDDDTEKMLDYMNGGGDVIFITNYTGTAFPNYDKLLDFYGISVSDGLIIEGDKNYYYRDPFYLLPEIASDSVTSSAYSSENYAFVPYAQGLTGSEKEDVELTSLLTTSDKSYVRTDLKGSQSYDRQEGDIDGPFDVGIKCEKITGEESSTAIIYSSSSLFTESADAMVAGTNLKLFTGTLGSFVSYESSISIPVKNYELSYLTLSEKNIVLIALITVIIIPFTFLISGFVIWFKRRKQ